MCQKVVATFQQTFQNNDDSIKRAEFRFNRIYKSKPEQYFRVKCVSLSSIVRTSKFGLDNPHCGEMYLYGLSAFNRNCNFKSNSVKVSHSANDNRMYLGDLNGSTIPDCYFILDDIPLDNFFIQNDNFDGFFTVCFHIELIDP